MRPIHLLTALTSVCAIASVSTFAQAQEPPPPATPEVSTPPAAAAVPSHVVEHEDSVLIGSGVHQGGYGAPEVKLTSFTGDAAMLVGGQAGWIIGRHFVLEGYSETVGFEPWASARSVDTPWT